MLQLYRDIRYSLDPRYELELAVSRLSWVSDYVSSADMKAAIVQARNLLLRGPVPVSAKPVEKTEAAPRGDGGPFRDADRSVEPDGMIRSDDDIAEQLSSETSVSDDEDIRIENPFAAFKERLNGSKPASVSATFSLSAADSLSDTKIESRVCIASFDNVPSESVSGKSVEPSGSDVLVEQHLETGKDPVPFASLPEALVACFQTSKNMVATGLSQATNWRDDGSTVHFSVDKPFMHNFLEQDHKAISDAISRLLCRRYSLEIHLETAGAGDSGANNQSIPAEVEMIRHMFRGTITGDK